MQKHAGMIGQMRLGIATLPIEATVTDSSCGCRSGAELPGSPCVCATRAGVLLMLVLWAQ
jgi:hypothetical protein